MAAVLAIRWRFRALTLSAGAEKDKLFCAFTSTNRLCYPSGRLGLSRQSACGNYAPVSGSLFFAALEQLSFQP